MAQPTAYDPTTDFSEEEASGVAGRSTVRTAAVDAEFANLRTTLSQIIANLGVVQRDDTALRDGIVAPHALSASLLSIFATAGSTVRGAWLTATAYAVSDVVTNSTGTYICATAHTSGTFATDLAAVKWLLIFDTAGASTDLANTSNAAKGDKLIGFKRTFTSAVASTLHDWHEQQAVCVKADAGAVGDGTTDDTVAIQAAISSGKTVIFEDGLTFLTQGLTLGTAGQAIIIRGAVKLKNATNQPVFTVNANRTRIIFQGGSINGNKANQTTTTDGEGEGIWLANNVSKCEIWDPYIYDTRRSGIAGYGNNPDCLVIGGEITDANFMGIYPSLSSARPSKRWQISGVTISGFQQDGIGTVGIQHGTISGNRIVIGNSGTPISCIALEALCHYTSVFGNTCEGSASVGSPYGTGIQTNSSHHVTIVGNTIKGCTKGICVPSSDTSTHNIVISGNTLEDCGYAGWAIELIASHATNYDMRAIVSGNTINNSPYTAIALWGPSHCQVVNNNIYGVNLQNIASKRFVAGIVLGNVALYNIVSNNVINGGASGNMKIGIHEMAATVGGGAGGNTIRDNRIIGADYDVLCGGTAYGYSAYSKVTRTTDAAVTAVPTTGHWERGDCVLNEQPVAGNFAGWVCTVSGTFGATSTTGSITSGTTSLVVASATGLYAGMKIKIAGAGPAAADLTTYIASFDGTGTTCAVKDAASTTVAAVAVTLVEPTFERAGQISLSGSATYDPANLVDGAGATTTVTVTGAVLGDFAEASFSLDLQGITVTAWVSASDTVSVRFQNESGGAIDLGSGTLRARVRKL